MAHRVVERCSLYWDWHFPCRSGAAIALRSSELCFLFHHFLFSRNPRSFPLFFHTPLFIASLTRLNTLKGFEIEQTQLKNELTGKRFLVLIFPIATVKIPARLKKFLNFKKPFGMRWPTWSSVNLI
jgi:hypothetical protein